MVGNKLIIHGGIGRYDVMLSDMWLYDLDSEQWQQISKLTNIARFHHNLQIFPIPYTNQAKAVLFGGHGDETNMVYTLETPKLSYGNDLAPMPHLTPTAPFQDVIIEFSPAPKKKSLSMKQTLKRLNTQQVSSSSQKKDPLKMKELAKRPKTPELQLSLQTPRKKRKRPTSARSSRPTSARSAYSPSPRKTPTRRFTKTQRPSSARPKTTRTQLLRQKKKQEEKTEALKKVYFTHVYKTHDRIIVDKVNPDKIKNKPPSPEKEPENYNYEDHPSLWDTLAERPPDNTQYINHNVTIPAAAVEKKKKKRRLLTSPNQFDTLTRQSYRYTSSAASPVYKTNRESMVRTTETFSYQSASDSLIDVE
eukprot:CAMPEP_0117428138 /NCGR_PEP_ID=MMETSP0758-20121206/7920_1 /TAXON_ID=63605 /ORGANISM="Percolomonas cosmopolitus, Strain AE-1 (ATCC 50343)" /LENGTH=362 /DNA_ID=CAMNT_0005214343 /DNA_START=970 /DNA_END=2055 /DNA_ORIENTATION=-